MNPEQLKEMNEIDWWHTMELDGVMTKGRDYTYAKLETIKLPEDLKGKTVIDVGAWDGFFSFEAERRGAKVLAIDTIMWEEHKTFNIQQNRETMHTGKKGFDFAHKILNSKVESEFAEVMDLDMLDYPTKQFDLVLCLGILYHMKDPLGMCQVMYDICKPGGMLILETHYIQNQPNIPMMIFYPTNECNNDPGNWWGPNTACVDAMLKVTGFKKIECVHIAANRVVFHAIK